MDLTKLRQIYNIAYQNPTLRRVIDTKSDKIYTNVLSDLTCFLEKGNNAKHYHFYVTKYYDLSNVRTLIIDFDNNDSNKAYDDIKFVSNILQDKEIIHFVVDSTNKGYHLYIILPKPVNFLLTRYRNTNNRIYKKFIHNLICIDTENKEYRLDSLDEVNNSLFSNIRQIGSVHPKTGKILKIVYAFGNMDSNLKINHHYVNDKITNEYIYRAFVGAVNFFIYKNKIDNIIKSRYKHKSYTNDAIDLRTLFNGKSYDGGKSIWTKCHWHNDEKPSLHIYEKVAFCEVCGMIPFNKIKEEFNL